MCIIFCSNSRQLIFCLTNSLFFYNSLYFYIFINVDLIVFFCLFSNIYRTHSVLKDFSGRSIKFYIFCLTWDSTWSISWFSPSKFISKFTTIWIPSSFCCFWSRFAGMCRRFLKLIEKLLTVFTTEVSTYILTVGFFPNLNKNR